MLLTDEEQEGTCGWRRREIGVPLVTGHGRYQERQRQGQRDNGSGMDEWVGGSGRAGSVAVDGWHVHVAGRRRWGCE